MMLARAISRWLAPWHEQRGEVVTSLLVLADVALVAVLTLVTSGQNQANLKACVSGVATAKQALITKYGPSGTVPPDDTNVTFIRQCNDVANQVAQSLASSSSTAAAVKNLASATQSTLSSVGVCAVTQIVPGAPLAGVQTGLGVYATIPFTGAGVADEGSTITVNGTPLALGMLPFGSFTWTGAVDFSKETSRAAAGTVSVATVKFRSDVGRNSDGTCPSGTDASTPGQCILRCTATKNAVWQTQAPDIRLFQAFPSVVARGSGAPVTLTWLVNDADTVTITPDLGLVDPQGFTLLFPDQDTTYTLTATGPSTPPCAGSHPNCTAATQVRVTAPPIVQLTAPANNGVVTSNTVNVSGTVQNAAPGQTVQISLNGVPKGSLTIVSGTFAGVLTLAKTLSLGDFFLDNPSTSITSQGPVVRDVTMGNSKSAADVTNVITASLGTSSDTVVVSHAVQVTDFQVAWPDCPAAPGIPNVPQTIGAGQSVRVGSVQCGITGGGFCRACTVHVSVATSVGSGGNDATWVFNVPPCPAISEIRK